MKKKRKIKKSNFCLFLSDQNLILKIIFIFLSFILTFFVDKIHFIALFFITIISLGFCIKIYTAWIKIILRILPLFISLYIFVIILSADFLYETSLIIKIIYLTLLSAYLIETTPIRKVAEDLHYFMKYSFFNNLFFFIIMTISFIPVLIDKLSGLGKGKSLENCLNDTLNYSKSIYDSLKCDVDEILSAKKKYNIWTLSNLYLIFYIVLIFLLALS